jgi:hypothetical protein
LTPSPHSLDEALTALQPSEITAPPSAWPVCRPAELGGLLSQAGWSLVEFWAPDCLFSRLLLPVRVQVARSHGAQLQLRCCVLDSVTTGAAEFGAEALPALVLFDGARRVRRWLGAIDAGLLRYHLSQVLADAPP